jgi:hypothetical protein
MGFWWESQKERDLRRTRRRWEITIKTDISLIGSGGTDWIYLAQDRDTWRALLNTIMNLRSSGRFLRS